MDKITILTTWWTIDKDYWVGKWIYDVEIWEPIVWKVLKNYHINLDYEIIKVLQKDSLDMTDSDRLLIKEKIKWLDNNKILITHWTDTMIETWKILQELKDKIIVMIGAERPWSMKYSDAEFNIWYALWVLKILSKLEQKWVFIAMNWECFDVNNVEKWEDWVFRKIK